MRAKVANAFRGKRKYVAFIAAIMVMLVPFSVFAATSEAPAAKSIRGFFGIDPSGLSEQQQADIDEYAGRMAQLQKEFIDRMVANGALTSEQGEAAKARVDEMLEQGIYKGLFGGIVKPRPDAAPDAGAARDKGVKPNFGRIGPEIFRKPGFFGLGKVDISELTDEQNATLKEIKGNIKELIKSESESEDFTQKLIALEKEFVNKLLAFGVITQEQADAAISRIEEKDGFVKPIRPLERFGKGGILRQTLPKGECEGNCDGDCDGECSSL